MLRVGVVTDAPSTGRISPSTHPVTRRLVDLLLLDRRPELPVCVVACTSGSVGRVGAPANVGGEGVGVGVIVGVAAAGAGIRVQRILVEAHALLALQGLGFVAGWCRRVVGELKVGVGIRTRSVNDRALGRRWRVILGVVSNPPREL